MNHHLCHAAAAYFGWGKVTEKILVLTCDGSGDGICASVNVGNNSFIQKVAQVDKANSIGRLYAYATHLMGMLPLEHEYKLMGLAPYAEKAPEADKIAKDLAELFEFDNVNRMTWKRKRHVPPMQQAYPFLAKYFRNKRFDHIAAGVQIFTERFLTTWVRNCIRETGIRQVALSGGVFMNVKANQKILELEETEKLFIFPSCGDESNAIGACYLSYREHNPNKELEPLASLYLANHFDNNEVETTVSNYNFSNNVKIKEIQNIEKHVSELLSKGQIVARFKGKMEFGARALGNRSILANASNTKTVRVINEMIKNRDFWMPFAPSVLSERIKDYFIVRKPMKAPYMIVTFDTIDNKRDKMLATLHPNDYTARPHEVYAQWNGDYYNLLKYYEELTGEGIILNTSFNLHGEPIVYLPSDALRVFDVSGLQNLAIENYLITKV